MHLSSFLGEFSDRLETYYFLENTLEKQMSHNMEPFRALLEI